MFSARNKPTRVGLFCSIFMVCTAAFVNVCASPECGVALMHRPTGVKFPTAECPEQNRQVHQFKNCIYAGGAISVASALPQPPGAVGLPPSSNSFPLQAARLLTILRGGAMNRRRIVSDGGSGSHDSSAFDVDPYLAASAAPELPAVPASAAALPTRAVDTVPGLYYALKR